MLLILGCSIEEKTLELDEKPNILLIIADDMGLDATPGYEIGSAKPNMPNLESLMYSGISFNNVWATPECSPTRATILTGKYGFRTKVFGSGDIFSLNESSIFKVLNNYAPDYAHALIGKWHLTQNINDPYNMGVDYFAGILNGEIKDYSNWDLTQNGETIITKEYATTKLTNLAIDWLNSKTQPWFLWLAYNAPHGPFHLPPSNLHDQGSLPDDKATIASNPTPYYMSMIEAMDSEIGRLLNSMSSEIRENTIIIFIGDNGTPPEVAQEYSKNHQVYSRTKWTLYQGGINVPMIISGKNVNRFNVSEDALIGSVDLFATIADLAGTGIIKINDSKSFKELLVFENTTKSKYLYTEVRNRPNTIEPDHTIRNKTHKYIYYSNKEDEFYNLNIDPLESFNLFNSYLSANDLAIKDSLLNELDKIKN